MRAAARSVDVVGSAREAAAAEREPLLVLDALESFLDDAGLGTGPLDAAPIGDGHSNVTYELRRGRLRLVLRRPPRGPLAPSAHDVLREARLLRALHAAAVRVPEIVAVCDDPTLIGAPFYLMKLVEGDVLTSSMSRPLDTTDARAAIGEELVDALVEVHAVDIASAGLSDLGRSAGYLERQVRRFGGLLEHNATRPLPELERVADWLARHLPDSSATRIVHGDFRLGNAMFARSAPARLVAMLDWELATLGDPLADVGYLTATWAQPDDPPNPMLDLSRVTRLPGFANRAQLAERYAALTGLRMESLPWYQVLALWKSAIFLEGSYKRYLAGTTDDSYFARLGEGVPALARLALRTARASG